MYAEKYVLNFVYIKNDSIGPKRAHLIENQKLSPRNALVEPNWFFHCKNMQIETFGQKLLFLGLKWFSGALKEFLPISSEAVYYWAILSP